MLRFTSNSNAILRSTSLIEATQAEAEDGSVQNRYMSPLRVSQAIDAQVGGGAGVTGPANSIDHGIVRFAGTGGDEIEGTDVIVNDGGSLSIPDGVYLPNDGLRIEDTAGGQLLTIQPGSNLSADRTLTITTGDANRTIALAADLTIPADPAADRILFWDDSADATAYLTPGNGLTISTTTIEVDAASTTVDGIMELATASETIVGTDMARAIAPGSQHTRIVYLSAQHSVASTTATEVTGLQFSVAAAGTYRFSYWLLAQSGTAADGLTFGINYTGTASKLVAMLSWPDTGVTAALGAVDNAANAATGQLVAYAITQTETTTAPDLSTGTAGVATTGSNLFLKIEGIVVVTDTGDLELWHGCESTNATTVEVGSSLTITRVN